MGKIGILLNIAENTNNAFESSTGGYSTLELVSALGDILDFGSGLQAAPGVGQLLSGYASFVKGIQGNLANIADHNVNKVLSIYQAGDICVVLHKLLEYIKATY